MFTGIIAYLGKVEQLVRTSDGLDLTIEAGPLACQLRIGDSVCTQGVCLTATKVSSQSYTAHAVSETLNRSSLAQLKVGSRVNLELALAMGDRLGGHMVSGHIDGVGKVESIAAHPDGSKEITIAVPKEVEPYCVHKGSIAIDGISLTIARLQNSKVSIAVIPHTLEVTSLGQARVGDSVNLEADLIGKYIEKLALPHLIDRGVTAKKMEGWGYGVQ